MPLKNNAQWVGTSKGSIFAYRPFEFSPGENHYRKIRFTVYCQERHISKAQGRTLIKKKWLGVTHYRNNLWVHEICPDEINDFLMS